MIYNIYYIGIFSAVGSWWGWYSDSCRRLFDADHIFPLTRSHRHPAEWGVPVQVLHILPVCLMSFMSFEVIGVHRIDRYCHRQKTHNNAEITQCLTKYVCWNYNHLVDVDFIKCALLIGFVKYVKNKKEITLVWIWFNLLNLQPVQHWAGGSGGPYSAR